MAEFNNIEVEDLLNLKNHLHEINLNYNNNEQEGIIMGFGPPNDDEETIMEKQRSATADQCFSMMTFNNEIQIPSYDHHHHHPLLSPHLFSPMEGGTSHHVALAQPYPLKNYGRRKRKRNNNNDKGEGDHGKAKEVVHVRAKRGQATDSHSLAERQRREKINEKLKSLQGLVPGCYKTMGMAVMLDVIINYIRSLQNQIDFLSMKLSAASLFYDFNSSEMDAVDLVHQGTSLYEAQEMGKAVFEGYGAFPPQFQTPNWPL